MNDTLLIWYSGIYYSYFEKQDILDWNFFEKKRGTSCDGKCHINAQVQGKREKKRERKKKKRE